MIDTQQFNEHSAEAYKENIRQKWRDVPCGVNTSVHEPGTREFFEEVENYRYRTHPFIKRAIESFDLKDRDVLEVGPGMGTDHLALARRGARMTGIDLTDRHLELTRDRFIVFGHESNLVLGDAESMPFEDNSFDLVYSLGVIHHTPNPEKIISEIKRVLRPGGRAWIAMYHKNSAYFWWTVLVCGWILNLGFLRESFRSRLNKIEFGDNPDLIIRLYTRQQMRQLFSEFSEVAISVDQMYVPDDVALFGPLIPQSLANRLAKWWGWYVIADVRK